jgi:hypothetical protein
MHADVAHQDGVLRKTAADLNGGTLRIDRLAVIAEAWGDQLVPFLSVAVDGLEPLVPRVGALAKIGPRSSSACSWRRKVRTSAIRPSATG